MAFIQVKPGAKGPRLSHPVGGPLLTEVDADGNWAHWPADQFTFQLLRDGAIERVATEPKPKSMPAKLAAPDA